MSNRKKAKVAILMSSYNGEKYIKGQIESLLNQKNVEIKIYVRDDGSTDKTKDILDYYQKNGKLTWYTGENLRPAKSFLNLLKNVPDNFDYYALCDQDDYWLDDKVEIAVNRLKEFDQTKPLLYYGCPRLVDSELNYIKTPKTSKDCMKTYFSSIINSNATGCTMVFNKELLKEVNKKNPEYMIMHDAWIHKVCIIKNGILCFDDDVHILYRQHGNNQIGISNSYYKKIKKRFRNLKTKECSRSKMIKSFYNSYSSEMSEEERKVSELVINYQKNLKSKLKLLFCKKIKTDYFYRNFFYKLAILFNAF